MVVGDRMKEGREGGRKGGRERGRKEEENKKHINKRAQSCMVSEMRVEKLEMGGVGMV